MKPTIVEGDRILVNKLAYDLKVPGSTHIRLMSWGQPVRGDIVVFDSEAEKTRLVKRVVGLPGDTLAMQDNQLFINGALLHYSGLGTDGAARPRNIWAIRLTRCRSAPARRRWRQFRAHDGSARPVSGAGRINRDNSKDSRYIGFVRAAKSSAARDMWFYRSITTIITCRGLDGSFSLSMPLTAH